MHVVLSLEVTFFQNIIIPAEVSPIALILKFWGVVIDHRSIPDGAVMGFKMNDRKLLGINRSLGEIKTIHHHMGGIDLQEGGSCEQCLSRALGTDREGTLFRTTTRDINLRIRPIPFRQHDHIPRPRRAQSPSQCGDIRHGNFPSPQA